jgi:hypothetical protein
MRIDCDSVSYDMERYTYLQNHDGPPHGQQKPFARMTWYCRHLKEPCLHPVHEDLKNEENKTNNLEYTNSTYMTYVYEHYWKNR